MILRLLGPQGIAGLAAALCLGLLLLLQKGETRHWRKESAAFEQLYRSEQSARIATIENYRSAANQARRDDAANAARVVGEQSAINERIDHDYQARIVAARAAAERLRVEGSAGPADRGRGGTTPVPGLPAAAVGADQGTGQDGLSPSDRLIATEQAIQLDELIKWVRQQHSVDINGAGGSPRRD